MKNKIRVFEAFAGYGSQSMALRRLGIDYEVIGISEIDKYAIQAYMAVHGETPNYGDISKIDWKEVPDFDFLTYSFPCTDISSAGLQKGLEEGSGTRSSLLWECKKAIEAKKPKYLLMENVKALTYKKFRPYLEKWLDYLKDLGYTNFAKVLNAKNYGVPQNRERIFVVSVLGCADYSFPEGFELDKRLKDVLEKDVDESFYLSEKNTFLARNEKNKAKGNGFKFEPTTGDVIASTIGTHSNDRDCDNYVYVVGNTNPSGHGMNGNVFDSNGLCPTLTTNKGEGPRILESVPTGFSSKEKKYGNKRVQSLVDSGKISGHEVQFLDAYNQTVSDICGTIKTTVDSSCLSFISEPINQALIIKQATKKGYIEIPPGGVFDASYPESLTRRGRVQDNGKVSPTLTAGGEPPCLYEGTEVKIFQSPRGFNKGAILDNCSAITSSRWQDNNFVVESKIIQVGNLVEDKGFKNPQRGRVYNPIGISPNIDTMGGGNLQPKIIEGFTNYRIRKLTPRECFRLMGVSEKDIDNIQQSGISKTQQYKMAGNSIVVDVLYYIFKKMFVDKSCEDAQLSIF